MYASYSIDDYERVYQSLTIDFSGNEPLADSATSEATTLNGNRYFVMFKKKHFVNISRDWNFKIVSRFFRLYHFEWLVL